MAKQAHSIIAEENGKMVHLNNTVILEGLTCQGICTKNCPRAQLFLLARDLATTGVIAIEP